MNSNKNITITVPNKDTYLGTFEFCAKEVLQKSYLSKIGGYIDYCGISKKVKDVQVADDFIFITLE